MICRLSHRARSAWVLLSLLGLLLTSPRPARGEPSQACGRGENWDAGMNMCMPVSASGRGIVIAAQFNAFGVFSDLQGPRGTEQFAAPNMFMVDAGGVLGAAQFINLDLMGTFERWTFPRHGYAELLQIGEERSDGSAYIDAQHPHSSPIMGLTLSDTVTLARGHTLKVSFAPRGESTDGPVAFMHRESAQDDPDAPLGHHVGQDVGHISSTVLAAQLNLGRWLIEASLFSGTEPQPTRGDLPLGPLDSQAVRLSYAVTSEHRFMASVAHVKQTDPAYPPSTSALRYSLSLYDHLAVGAIGTLDHTFVIGAIQRSPGYASLASFLDEVRLRRGAWDLWGRIEVLQRLASELEIPDALDDPTQRRWVSALTLGYTRWLPWRSAVEVGLGGSLGLDQIPEDWVALYGHRHPITARVLIQVRGSGRWHP